MPEPTEFPDMLQIAFRVQSAEELRRLFADESIDFGCRAAAERRPDGTLRVDAFIPAMMVENLRRQGYELEIVANVTATLRDRSAEVGRADLFERGRPGRRGLVQDVAPRPRPDRTE
jgi:hypothetical protein